MDLQVIQNKIYEIRGQKVMLDFDLAEMYEVETRRLKEQVKRNIERFPHDFMFQLSKSEWTELIAICDKLPEKITHTPVSLERISGYMNRTVKKLLDKTLIERTIPENPNHPAQKFRITQRGKMFLELLKTKNIDHQQ